MEKNISLSFRAPEGLCLESGKSPLFNALLCLASIFFLFFPSLTPSIVLAADISISAEQIKAEWLQKSPILQSYKSYDQVLSQVQKEYQQFHYPIPGDYSDEAALEKARQERIREIILFTVSNIKNSLSDFDTNRAIACLETGRDTLSSYGNQAVASLNTRIRPLLENFYKNLLTFQGKALVSFLHSLGKEYWVLSSWPQKYTWSETAASKNLFYPLTKINKSIDISTQIQKFLRHASTNTYINILQPSLFNGVQHHFGIPIIHKTVDLSQPYALLVAIQFFCSGSLDHLSSFLQSNIISSPSYTQFHETGPNYLLFTALDHSMSSGGTTHAYTGEINLLYLAKRYPIEVNVQYWILKLKETSKNQKVWRNNIQDMERIASDIAHKLLYSFLENTATEKPRSVFSLNPITTVNISTSPDKKDKCTLQVTVTDERNKPVKSASVSFKKPKLGQLSSLSVVTDSGGQAKVVYTAPTDEQLGKLGKEEVDVLVEATDVKTGKSSSVEIHVRSKHKAFATRIEHKILPAHPDYFNRISFAFRAANKPDASPYKALVTIQKGGYGALTKSNDDKGGTRKLELNVFPKKQYDFYYHWTGPAAMMKAYNEVVIIEIPELKLKRKVQFSVGIDLMIESVQMKYGNHVFPVMFEPFNIYIRDKFHPKADLVKIFKDFGINMDLKISQVAHVRVPPDPTQECILDALMTAWEGSSAYPHAEPIIYDGPMWGIKKTKNGRYIIWSTGKDSKGKTFVEYPGINVFERGTYQFEVKVSPGKFDADPRNNNAITDTIEIKDFPSEAGELLHTVFLPSAEFLVSLSSRFEIQFAYAVKDITLDLMQGDVKGAFGDLFINIWLNYCGVVRTDKLKKAEFFAKIGNTKLAKQLRHEANLLLAPTLAVYTKTLCDRLLKILYTNQSNRKLLPPFHLTSPAYAGELSPKTFNESDVFRISQLTLKGAKDYYLVVINRGGIESLDAKTSTGVKLRKAPSKISVKMKEDEIIFQGKNYIVIPVGKDEKIDLSLSGTGRSGKLTVITPDRITYYKYPSSKWKSILEVYASGNITTKQGNEFEPINILKIAGTWNTNFGKIILAQHGNIVTGHYTHDNGKIVGFLKGNIFKGKWSEAPTYKPPHDAGDCEFIFLKNGKSFSGNWRYGFGGNSWNGDWSGEKLR